jgi:hypothetical protein
MVGEVIAATFLTKKPDHFHLTIHIMLCFAFSYPKESAPSKCWDEPYDPYDGRLQEDMWKGYWEPIRSFKNEMKERILDHSGEKAIYFSAYK